MSREQGLWGRIFIGNLPASYSENEVRDIFKAYNGIKRVDCKREYGYIYFEDVKEAEQAVRDLNGTTVEGKYIKVQNVSKQDGDKKEPPKYELRIRVHNLNPRTSWQDLKDWARNAGAVQYANVFTRGAHTMGVIEFQDIEGFESSFKVLEAVPLNREKVRISKESEERDDDIRGQRDTRMDSYVQRDTRRDDRGYDSRPLGTMDRAPRGGYDSYRGGGNGSNLDSARSSYPPYDSYRGGGGAAPAYDRRYSDDRRPPNVGTGGAYRSRSRSREAIRRPVYDSVRPVDRRDDRGMYREPAASYYATVPSYPPRSDRGGGGYDSRAGGGGYDYSRSNYDRR